MRQKIYLLAVALATLLQPQAALAHDTQADAVTQLQFGRQVVTVPADANLTFYDPKGTGSISSTSTNNTHSLTVFRPAEAGLAVRVEFEEIDVSSDGAGYPGQVVVYNGDPDEAGTFSWATNAYGINGSTVLPEGDVVATLDGEYSGVSYYSTAPDGTLSVGMLWRYAAQCDGWVAKVSCVKLENMVVSGAGADYSAVLPSPRGKQAIALASAYVEAKGVLQAGRLAKVTFSLPKNDGVVDPLSLRLYAGAAASFKGAEPLQATVAADGGAYAFTLDEPLSEGRNVFTIAGDVLATASVGAEVAVEVTSVSTTAIPDGVQPFVGATPVTVTCPAIVNMEEGATTVTVGSTPLAFYDDGGLDGQVTPGFSGTTTFLPEAGGKKVQVSFSSVNLSEGSIYYQYLNVYNGTAATEGNLIRRVRSGETALIHSTAADGALTVELSNNGTSYTAAGFEAEVSLFEPQPMELESIAVDNAAPATACAGEAGVAMLRVNVRTANTEPALAAGAFGFTTGSSSATVSGASLFYTGSSQEFSSARKVGAVVSVDHEFTITPDEEVSLSEGDNYFWLVYDVDQLALNGQQLDAALVSVELGEATEQVAEGNPEGGCTIENVVYSHAGQGSVTTTVNGSLAFRTKTKNEYSEDYESGTDDRINVFVPLNEGNVCQIDFSKFDLYYSSSSYGAKAIFRIYSGQGTDGELLWELASADDKATGPGRVIRSTAADGALTVLFNPNESASWYTESGIDAVVSEYRPQPMAIDSVAVAQTTTDIVAAGAAGQALLTVNVATKGSLRPVSLESVSVNMKGSQAKVAKLWLYSVGAADGVPQPDAKPVGEATVAQGDPVDTIMLNTPMELAEGSNFFRILFDLSDDATDGDVIDASVVFVTVGGEQMAVDHGDPEGSRVVKNILNLQQGDNGEVTVKAGQSLLFYDDGGSEQPASTPFDGTVTFAPGAEGEAVRLHFSEVDVNCTDTLYVFAGESTSKDDLLLAVECYDKLPADIVSPAADGKLTVRYVVRGTYSAPDGFAIAVSSYRKKALEVASVTVADCSAESVVRGQDDALMLRVDARVEGDYGTLEVSKFAVEAAEAASLRSVKVYSTDTIGSFAAFDAFGQSQSAPYEVTGSYTISAAGTYKFWVVCDVAADAAAGSQLTATLRDVTIGGTAFSPQAPATASCTVREGASGTLTVGQGSDYGTIQAAVDAIAGGIEGPVTINVKPGIYNELVNVPQIPGASATNTVTIQSATGDYNDVRIYYDAYSEPEYSDDKMSAEYGVVTVAGADYLTLRGLEITTTDLTFPGVVHIKGASRHVTVDSCHIHASMSTEYGSDINLIYTYAKDEANCNNDYLTVRNSLLEGGYIGIRMGGTNYLALPKERGGVIEGNTLRNQGAKALYVMDELGVKIRRNTIFNDATDRSGFQGFDGQLRDACAEPMVIEANVFDLATLKDAIAINPRQLVGTAEAPVVIANNEVRLRSDNASSAGMKIGSPCEHLRIAYNTVRLTGTAASAPLWLNDAMTGDVVVENNVLLNEAGGYVYRFYKQGNENTATFRNNVLYTSGEVFAYNKADITTFADWVEAAGEQDSHNEAVGFLSDEVLEPAAEGSLLTARAVSYVQTDITGRPRTAQPTIGAYEFDATAAAPALAEGYPSVRSVTDSTACVAVKANANSTAFITIRRSAEAAPAADGMTAEACSAFTIMAGREAAAFADTLEAGGEYVAYVRLVSLRGVGGAVVASAPFVASGEAIVEIPNVELAAVGDTIAAGSTATLSATVSGGTAPFKLTWLNGLREDIATANLDAAGEAQVAYEPSECDDYYVTVTDANGKQATDTCRVVVTGKAMAATMENLWLGDYGAWAGPDTKGELVTGEYLDQQLAGSFVSGSYMFSNNYSLDYGSWSGFAYSNRTSTAYEGLDDQYNSAAGSGHGGSANYAVGFGSGKVTVLSRELGDTISGLYVTNTAYALNSIINGDSYSSKFEQGSFLKVVFTGTRADGTTATVESYLADYRQADAADHYYLDTWQWVDLRPLGKVVSLSFAIDGSDKSYGYLNTPAYFCLDDLGGERDESLAPVQAGRSVRLADFFVFADNAGTVSYALPDAQYDGTDRLVEITADGRLVLSDAFEGQATITVSATQRGKVQFVRIPFDIASGITDAVGDDNAAESRYDLSGRRVSPTHKGINIVKMADGTVRKVVVK